MKLAGAIVVALATLAVARCSQLPAGPAMYEALADGLKELKQTGVAPQSLNDLIDGYGFNKNILRWGQYPEPRNEFMCNACLAIIDAALNQLADGANRDEMVEYMTTICTTFTTELPDVCRGLMEINVDVAMFIFANKPEATNADVCGIVYQDGNCTVVNETPWEINIDPGQQPLRPQPSNEPPLKILHISDIHYDPYYYAGGSKNCGRPTCCAVPEEGEEVPVEDQAGLWGSWPCDTPMNAVEEACQSSLAQHPDLDYVYFTGDMISHRVWNTSIEENKRDLTDLFTLMANVYGNIPVYPVLGNHEPHPVNVFSPNNMPEAPLETSWLYEQIAEEWMVWLPEDTKETLLRGGFYTVLVRPGFRVVAINSNVCYTYNWWLIYNSVDQYGQLQWLADTLQAAEDAGEMVHILSHIPAGGGSCWITWSREYKRIIERYSNTIAAQFNGHTHTDELKMFFKKSDPNELINIAWNGGSLTTFTDKNPNYKVYSVDPASFEVMDFESWYYDVEVANTVGTPQWTQMYSSFSQAFGLSDVRLTQMSTFPNILLNEVERYNDYYKFMVRDALPAMEDACLTDECRLNEVCGIVTSEYGDNAVCDALTQQ